MFENWSGMVQFRLRVVKGHIGSQGGQIPKHWCMDMKLGGWG